MKRSSLFLIGRILIGGLFFFEVLNWLGVLHFHLEFTWLGLMLTSGFVWLICEIIMQRFSTEALPEKWRGYLLLGACVPVYLDALGDMNLWYGTVPYYDKYLHFFGGFSIAIMVAVLFSALAKQKKSSFQLSSGWIAYITFLTATGFGVLYEFEEYLEDVFTGSRRSGGGPDTAGDLLFDVLGALIVTLVLWQVWKRKKKIAK